MSDNHHPLQTEWLETLYNDLAFAIAAEPQHILRCETMAGAHVLMHGSKLREAPSNAFHWLEQFARDNALTLRERPDDVSVADELRKHRAHQSQLALGVQLLLQQAAPLLAMRLQDNATERHVFRAATSPIGGARLVQLAHTVKSRGKRFSLDANSFLRTPDDKDEARDISLYACTLNRDGHKKSFAWIESASVHALMYQSANQCLFDLIIAGGFGRTAICQLPFSRLHKERLSLTFFSHPDGHAYAGLLRSCYAMSLDTADSRIPDTDFSDLIAHTD